MRIFFEGSVSLQSINSSFITLVPKTNRPTSPNDFRPILLLNSALNKTGTILDCLGWSFEYIHQYHQSRRELVLFKLDFEKAIETIEHSCLLEMLQYLGFNEKWIQWVQRILETCTSSILLNDTSGENKAPT